MCLKIFLVQFILYLSIIIYFYSSMHNTIKQFQLIASYMVATDQAEKNFPDFSKSYS